MPVVTRTSEYYMRFNIQHFLCVPADCFIGLPIIENCLRLLKNLKTFKCFLHKARTMFPDGPGEVMWNKNAEYKIIHDFHGNLK